MAIIRTLHNFLGKKLYPKTVTKAIYDLNGNRLDVKLEEIDGKLVDIDNKIANINDSLSGLKISVSEVTRVINKGINLFTWEELKLNIDYTKIFAINGMVDIHSLISAPINDTGDYDMSYALRVTCYESGMKIFSNTSWGERTVRFIIFHN